MTSSPRETELCRYHYDPFDRLISHALANTPERQRFYCKSRVATEIQGSTSHSIIQHGDQLLAQQQSDGDALDTTLLVTDQQRSVLHTLKANNQRPPIAYSPYGHRPAENGLLSLLGFNGERPDSLTGCYVLGMGYRAFNPVLMRFNRPDSWSPFGEGGLNSYAYCWGDPINLMDPIGHSPIAQAFKSSSKAYLGKSLLRSVHKKISKTGKLAPNAQKELLSKEQKALENLMDETLTLQRVGNLSGDIKPFRLPENLLLATKKYFHHHKAGIPYNKSGIPNLTSPVTTQNESGQEVLRTDFFDDAAGFFHHLARENLPMPEKNRLEEAAGKTIIKRAKYIRQHALRNVKPE